MSNALRVITKQLSKESEKPGNSASSNNQNLDLDR